MRVLALLVALLALPVAVAAAERGGAPATPPTTIQSEEPDPGEEDEGSVPELRDEDDGLDDGGDGPTAIRGRPRAKAPEEDDEEPPLPPARTPPLDTGPAQPASAMQPVSPEQQ